MRSSYPSNLVNIRGYGWGGFEPGLPLKASVSNLEVQEQDVKILQMKPDNVYPQGADKVTVDPEVKRFSPAARIRFTARQFIPSSNLSHISFYAQCPATS